MKPLWLILLLLGVCACQPSPNPSLQLLPLPPYRYEFTDGAAQNRIDYFYIDPAPSDTAQLKQTLPAALLAKIPDNNEAYTLYSVYVYQKTAALDPQQTLQPAVLRASHKQALISYSRWNNGRLTLSYLLENGMVVYDLLTGQAVSPAWEFD